MLRMFLGSNNTDLPEATFILTECKKITMLIFINKIMSRIYSLIFSSYLPRFLEEMEWPTPKNVLEVSSFMGLAGYFRWVVKSFSKIANPITKLQKKNKKFVWTEKCAEAFWRLKELLTTTLILKVPNMDVDFLVSIDASEKA